MLPIITSEKSKQIDSAVIENLRISSGELMMENAARSALEIIRSHFGLNFRNCLVLCGVGNNGGDGFALARLLSEYIPVDIYVIGDLSKMSFETKMNYEFAKNNDKKINITHIQTEEALSNLPFNYDIIIDALIGVGGNENLRGLVIPLLKMANRAQALKVAIDVPTGLNANTGKFHPDVFQSDATITMFAKKRAMLDKRLLHIFGEIYVAYLGFDRSQVMNLIDEWEVAPQDIHLLNQIAVDANKYDCGRIAILAGSDIYPGAAAIAANAACTAGAGLVHLFSTVFHPSLRAEVIQRKLTPNSNGFISSRNFDFLANELRKFDVVAIGPGIGNDTKTLELVSKLIDVLPCKIILDADALRVVNYREKLSKNIVITPHLGEFARILALDKTEIEYNRIDLALSFAQKFNTNILLKGSTTIVTNGNFLYYSTSGNKGLASGGTGDALTGIIAAFAHRCDDLALASAIGAFIHGLAADLYASEVSTESLTASEIINYLGKAISAAYKSC